MAIPYYRMLVWSMPFIMLFFTFKQFLEGVGNTKVEMFVTIVANLANIGFNWVFIYGRYGFPEMGAEGAGLGTLMSRIIAPILMIGYFYSRSKYRVYLEGFSPRNYSWATVKQLLHMGLPISMQMFLEASAFVGTGIMMGWFNKETMSANQIATTIGNCAFMIVMSIGAATTIRVSHCYGARNIGELSLAAISVVPPRAGVERLRSHRLHHDAQRHPDALHHQRRGDRHRLAADGLRRAVPAFGRHPERLGGHSAGYSGREDHHADRLRIVRLLNLRWATSSASRWAWALRGSFLGFSFRTLGRRRDDDPAHPPQHSPFVCKRQLTKTRNHNSGFEWHTSRFIILILTFNCELFVSLRKLYPING